MKSFAEIIRSKRDGNTLSDKEIQFFITKVVDGGVSREQISALTMAIFFRGMSVQEKTTLTSAMAYSGKVLAWDMPCVVDKHSTGGVGDKVSLMLAPLLAACGLYVPMISGRGLGHTGGTLDKLDAIPGYNTTPTINTFKSIVNEIGCAIIGQTSNLAPADKIIYGIRDVTATVESIPLITASILSKKKSAGINCLAMDIKFGTGAFMTNSEDAQKLASSIVETGKALGIKTSALLSDMNSPLGRNVGNALEVAEAVEFLKNPENADTELINVTLELGANIMQAANNPSHQNAMLALHNKLHSGEALEKFQQMISALGAPSDFCKNYSAYLPKANVITAVTAKDPGYLHYLDNRKIGLIITALGGNRTRFDDTINYAVGLSGLPQNGQKFEKGDKICEIHANDSSTAKRAEQQFLKQIQLKDKPLKNKPKVLKFEKIMF